MQIIRWQDATQPQEQELRNRMQQQGLSPYSWSNGPYDTYAVHSHSYEKVLYCVRGSIISRSAVKARSWSMRMAPAVRPIRSATSSAGNPSKTRNNKTV